jgi:hypothetical protein
MSNFINQNNKYNLLLCELHYTPIHGKTLDSASNIESHFIVYNCFSGFDTDINSINDSDDYEDDMPLSLFESINLIKSNYSRFHTLKHKHNFIRNFANIIKHPNYIQPQIGQCILLPTQEKIAILKTFWIRIIQKKWRKIYIQRKIIIRKRCHPKALYIYMLTGKWSKELRYLPSIKGLFYNIL